MRGQPRRGERILGPYRHHSGWLVAQIAADGSRESKVFDTEGKAERYMELVRAELAKDDIPHAVSMSRLSRLDGWVYAVLLVPETRPWQVKIGWTKDVRRRVGQFRNVCPNSVLVGLWDAVFSHEAIAHKAVIASGKGTRIRRSEVFLVEDVSAMLGVIDIELKCELPPVVAHEDPRALIGAPRRIVEQRISSLLDETLDGRSA